MEIFDLSRRIAIVTGGATGIGFGIARGLATAGAAVVIANRRVQKGQEAAESIRKEGLEAVAIPTDVSSMSSIASLVSKVVSDFGKIDILVNSAAVVRRGPAEEVTEEDWEYVIDTNLKGLFFCCQVVGREMMRNRKGKIINISSLSSTLAEPIRSLYATSKAGVSQLTRALAFEWVKYNINVNAIVPGLTSNTELPAKFFEEHPGAFEEFLREIPKGRAAYPEDYVGAAIFLASDASDYVVGHCLVVDGGMSIHH